MSLSSSRSAVGGGAPPPRRRTPVRATVLSGRRRIKHLFVQCPPRCGRSRLLHPGATLSPMADAAPRPTGAPEEPGPPLTRTPVRGVMGVWRTHVRCSGPGVGADGPRPRTDPVGTPQSAGVAARGGATGARVASPVASPRPAPPVASPRPVGPFRTPSPTVVATRRVPRVPGATIDGRGHGRASRCGAGASCSDGGGGLARRPRPAVERTGGVPRHPRFRSGGETRGRPTPTYVVQPGDTLWSIAERLDPTGDPRPVVAQLAAQVGGDTVVPGRAARPSLTGAGQWHYGWPVRCPWCQSLEDKVVDSRLAEDGVAIRRRRECLSCAAGSPPTSGSRRPRCGWSSGPGNASRSTGPRWWPGSGRHQEPAGHRGAARGAGAAGRGGAARRGCRGDEPADRAWPCSSACATSTTSPTCGSPRCTRASRTSVTSSGRWDCSRRRPSRNARS